MAAPFEVLCNWQPSRLDFETIKVESRTLLAELGIEPDVDPIAALSTSDPDRFWLPRTPQQNYELAWDEQWFAPCSWHDDGHLGYSPERLVVWSNVLPVEAASRDYSEYLMAKPGDVVLIFNRRAYHCMPIAVRDCERESEQRWSLQVWCKPSEAELHTRSW